MFYGTTKPNAESKLNLLQSGIDLAQKGIENIQSALRQMNFANIEEHGFMPLYAREKITDALHEACDFRTDYQFITKRKMREIQKLSKGRK